MVSSLKFNQEVCKQIFLSNLIIRVCVWNMILGMWVQSCLRATKASHTWFTTNHNLDSIMGLFILFCKSQKFDFGSQKRGSENIIRIIIFEQHQRLNNFLSHKSESHCFNHGQSTNCKSQRCFGSQKKKIQNKFTAKKQSQQKKYCQQSALQKNKASHNSPKNCPNITSQKNCQNCQNETNWTNINCQKRPAKTVPKTVQT